MEESIDCICKGKAPLKQKERKKERKKRERNRNVIQPTFCLSHSKQTNQIWQWRKVAITWGFLLVWEVTLAAQKAKKDLSKRITSKKAFD